MKTLLQHLKNPLTFGRMKVHNSEYGEILITTVYLFGFKVFTEVLTKNTYYNDI